MSTTSIDPSCLPTTTSTSSNSNMTFIIALASEGVVFLIVCIVLIVIIIAVYLGAKRNREKQIFNARYIIVIVRNDVYSLTEVLVMYIVMINIIQSKIMSLLL